MFGPEKNRFTRALRNFLQTQNYYSFTALPRISCFFLGAYTHTHALMCTHTHIHAHIRTYNSLIQTHTLSDDLWYQQAHTQTLFFLIIEHTRSDTFSHTLIPTIFLTSLFSMSITHSHAQANTRTWRHYSLTYRGRYTHTLHRLSLTLVHGLFPSVIPFQTKIIFLPLYPLCFVCFWLQLSSYPHFLLSAHGSLSVSLCCA